MNRTYLMQLLCIFEVLHVVCYGAIKATCVGTGVIMSRQDGVVGSTWLENCKYRCPSEETETSGYKFYELEDLTWDEIKRISTDIKHASDAGHCNKFEDLIYANDTTLCSAKPVCGCPVAADDDAEFEYHETFDDLFTQQCVGCKCMSPGTYKYPTRSYDEPQVLCSTRATVSNPYHWHDFQCPPVKLCNDSGLIRQPGQGWWKNGGDDCTTYCFCDFQGEMQCETGYAAIGNSKSFDFVNAFRVTCQSSLRTCLEDSSKWTEGSCKKCPKCGCGALSSGDNIYWIEEIENQASLTSASQGFDALMPGYHTTYDTSCYNCTCYEYEAKDVDNVAKGMFDAASCRAVASYLDGGGQCPPDASIVGSKCYDSPNDLVFDMDSADEEECSTTHGYCGWEYEVTVDYNGNVDIDHERGCQQSILCDAFNVPDKGCIYYQLDVLEELEAIDNARETCGLHPVPWDMDQFNETTYLSCCEGDLCNDYDIDITQCQESKIASQFWNKFNVCRLKAQYEVFHCSDDASDETDCKQLTKFGNDFYGCFCDAYSSIYGELNKANQRYARASSDRFWMSMNHWLEAFDCGTQEFGCNFKTGKATVDAVNPLSIVFCNAFVVFVWYLLF